MDESLIDDLVAAVDCCRNGQTESFELVRAYDYSPQFVSGNEFVILVKPECFSSLDHDQNVAFFRDLLLQFSVFEVEISGVCAFNAWYSRKHALLENQYAILNRGARYGYDALPPSIRLAIDEHVGRGCVVGAYPFLSEHAEMTAAQLEALANGQGSIKYGNGTYLMPYFPLAGETQYIINAFHPFQLEHFNRPGNVFLAIACASLQDYAVLAHDLVGCFIPEKASTGSLRHALYAKAQQYGLHIVDTLRNGYHISPSPLEGFFALQRYFGRSSVGLEMDQTLLGRSAGKHGLDARFLERLRHNFDILAGDKTAPVFDHFEGRSSDAIIQFLIKHEDIACQ